MDKELGYTTYYTDWSYDNCTEEEKEFLKLEMGVGDETNNRSNQDTTQ